MIARTLAIVAAAWAALAGAASAQALAGAGDPACQALLDYSAARRGVAVLVLKDGRPVCEGYAGDGAPGRGFELWSGTKSFTGIMAAAAVQDGLLKLDEPVSNTLTEWKADPDKARVTIRQLLSLTSGMPSRIGQVPSYAAAVDLPLISPPGAQFHYGPAPFQAFGELMTRKLRAAGRDPDPLAYLKVRILDPIGLKPTEWRRNREGDALLPQGAVLSVGEWAKYGEFIRAGARVDGRQIVDARAFEDEFKGSSANPSYGISWWLPRANNSPDPVARGFDLARDPGAAPRDMVIAAGAGDQRLYVIPSLHVTVAREAILKPGAGVMGGERWSDVQFTRLVLALVGARP